MFTTIITFIFTVFGALRATPLYSGFLTLGNGLGVRSWFGGVVVRFCLDDETTLTAERSIGDNLRTVLGMPLVLSLPPPPTVFTLPSPPILLTLPAGSSSRHLVYSELITLLTVVGVSMAVLGGLIWHLRAIYLGAIKEDIEDQLTRATIQFATYVPYDGDAFLPADQLAGVLEPSTVDPSSSPPLNELQLASSLAIKEDIEEQLTQATIQFATYVPYDGDAFSPVDQLAGVLEPSMVGPSSSPPLNEPELGSSSSQPLSEPTFAPSPAPSTIAEIEPSLAVERPLGTDENTNGGEWKTCQTNRRRRRPPRQPPSVFCASSSRSSSPALSTSPTTDTLLPSVRSYTRTRITTLPSSIISYNKFSLLEVFEVEE